MKQFASYINILKIIYVYQNNKLLYWSSQTLMRNFKKETSINSLEIDHNQRNILCFKLYFKLCLVRLIKVFKSSAGRVLAEFDFPHMVRFLH